MIFEQAMEKLLKHPKQLFLLDGFGALLSAFLLGVVLVKLENIFGIPRTTLYFLASLPCLFAIYDCYVYLMINDKVKTFLKGIAFINIGYCCISLGLAFYHFQKITALGWSYLILEIIIVMTIAKLEFSVANQL